MSAPTSRIDFLTDFSASLQSTSISKPHNQVYSGMSGRISLAEQIAQLEEAAPFDFDPEDLQSRGHEVEEEIRLDAGVSRQHYLAVGPSSLRNKLSSFAHPKYEGVRSSRKRLLEDSDDEHDYKMNEDKEEAGVEEEEERPEENEKGSEDVSQSEEEELPSESEEGAESTEEENRPTIPSVKQPRQKEESTEDMSSILKKTREENQKKGQAVKRQLNLWDTLLDTRIRMQKSLVASNRLPPPSEIMKYLENSECREAVSTFLREALLLSEELSELQEKLITANNVAKLPPRKRRRLDADASIEEYSEVFASATEDVAALEQTLHPYVLQTLSKWSSKIQAVAPSVLLPSNRGAFSKGSQKLKSVVQLIDENLADHDKLLARTQVVRVKKPRIDAPQEVDDNAEETVDPEIFDDTDFYQKLLRDIINARGNGNKSEDWMVLQKQKKAKKKVDTKASKGRKLRYEVHEKLQNFMVPVPVTGAWHEEQIDELFASLLGKGFENVTLNGNGEEQTVEGNVELTGLRVFG